MRLRWFALQLLRPYLRNTLIDKGKRFILSKLNPWNGDEDVWQRYGSRTSSLRRGGRIRCDLMYAADRSIYLTGEYELGPSRFMARVLGPGWRYIDVGANVGKHAIPAAFTADEVLCFEPNPGTRRMLEENLALNGLQSVRVLPFGLSDVEGHAALYQHELDIGGASLCASLPHTESHEIRLLRGDQIIPPSDKRTYLKIDVEGHELGVLKGLGELLSRRNCLVQVEITDAWLRLGGGSAEELFAFMRGRGYFPFALVTRTWLRTQVALVPLAEPPAQFQYDAIFAPFPRPDEVFAWAAAPQASTAG